MNSECCECKHCQRCCCSLHEHVLLPAKLPNHKNVSLALDNALLTQKSKLGMSGTQRFRSRSHFCFCARARRLSITVIIVFHRCECTAHINNIVTEMICRCRSRVGDTFKTSQKPSPLHTTGGREGVTCNTHPAIFSIRHGSLGEHLMILPAVGRTRRASFHAITQPITTASHTLFEPRRRAGDHAKIAVK